MYLSIFRSVDTEIFSNTQYYYCLIHCVCEGKELITGQGQIYSDDLMYVDPCIIVQFLQSKIQQDAIVYENFYYSLF